MLKYLKQIRRKPCWQVHGRNKLCILLCSFCALAATLTSYSIDDEPPSEVGMETYRNLNRLNGNWLLGALFVTFLMNALLAGIHTGEAFAPHKFVCGSDLLTRSWGFRCLEMINGAACSALVFGSATDLLFNDRSLIFKCTNRQFCSSTVASLIFSYATVVATLANFVIGLCETVKDAYTPDNSIIGSNVEVPSANDALLMRTISSFQS
ncbi:hypothetical protein BV898_13549 [Hypsibius exemplaris]|uniref:CASP-like protein n=1 Tax=Hypsibius exemplaris TaxID=2072580 RepID=A0A1W0WAK7_HYPEX|nr:hypothetical protein BV898_13549 [Hypsibius exemplaris]